MKYFNQIIFVVILAGVSISCQNESTTTDGQVNSAKDLHKDSLIVVGKAIAKTTFKTLSKYLQNEIQAVGIEGAIKYCNINAFPLTDSLSKAHNVRIKRVAERTRNEINSLNTAEQKVFSSYKAGDFSSPQISLNGEGKQVFYAPIKLAPMCVMCHGTKEQIGENYELISSLYPKDKAFGFVPDQLRGMWSITFN